MSEPRYYLMSFDDLTAEQFSFLAHRLGPFLNAVAKETIRARSLFPGNKQQLAAFSEEHGELANALIEHDRGKKSADDVFTEAVQAAAMACRVGIDGSSEFGYQWRSNLHMVVKPGEPIPRGFDLPCGGRAVFDRESGISLRCVDCSAVVGSIGMPSDCRELYENEDTTAKPVEGDVRDEGFGGAKPDGSDGRVRREDPADEILRRASCEIPGPTQPHPVQAAQHDEHAFDVVSAPAGDPDRPRLPGYTGQE